MGNALLNGMDILKGIAMGLGGLLVTVIIVLLVVGVLTNTVEDGSIPVSSSINTSVTGLETTATSATTAITNNITLIIGLVALVVILAVIGFMVFKSGKGKSSEGSF